MKLHRIDGYLSICEHFYASKMAIFDDMDNPFLAVQMTVVLRPSENPGPYICRSVHWLTISVLNRTPPDIHVRILRPITMTMISVIKFRLMRSTWLTYGTHGRLLSMILHRPVYVQRPTWPSSCSLPFTRCSLTCYSMRRRGSFCLLNPYWML